MKRKVLFTLFVLLIPGTLHAQSGTSVGLGEAYTTLARGSEAIFWNPANLAFRSEGLPSLSISLYSLKLNFGQNSIDRNMYNEFFTEKNKVLSSDDVQRLLDNIPDDGFRADFRSDMSVFAIAWKNFGISFEGNAWMDIKMPKDMVEIPFTGIEQKTYDFSPEGNVEAVGKINFAYGRIVARDKKVELPLNKSLNFTEIALGGTFSHIKGLGILKTESANLFTTLSDDGIVARGEIVAHGTHLERKLQDDGDYETEFVDDAGAAGSGYGFNLAASGKLDNGYIISFVLKNLLNKVTWDQSAMEIRRTLDTGDPKFIIGAGQLEDLDSDSITTDEDIEIGSFSTTQPMDIRFAVGRRAGRFMYASEIGRENEKFLFALGGGVRWFLFNLYGGYRYKSAHNVNFGIGFGGNHFIWDFGFGTRDGMTQGSNKGIIFASSMRFGF